MIYIRPGAHVLDLLQLLSVAGEFPMSGLSILSDKRTLRELVHKLEERQDIEVSWSGKRYCVRLLTVSGKRGPMRNIRLHKSALPILEELHPKALEYYLAAFRNHSFTGKRGDIERNHRVGETLAMMLLAGIEMRPYMTPPLQNERIEPTVGEFPSRLQVNGFVECDCDAVDGGKYILSHLDGDLARLVRFRLAAVEDTEHRYEAVCYPWQLEYVKPFLGERIELKLIDPARIAAALQGR